MSNCLESTLTELQCHFCFGSRNNGPLRVVGNFSEVFSFNGSPYSFCSVGKSERFSCNVEMVNCLNVPLIIRNKYYSNSIGKDFPPLEIRSFHRKNFLASSDTSFEAIFAYEIFSTDLAFGIGLKVGPGTNSFAAAFSQIPAVTEKNELEALKNPSQWKIHDYKKTLRASNTLE
ncbi:unnamed protein product, partial [Allacma fusca]